MLLASFFIGIWRVGLYQDDVVSDVCEGYRNWLRLTQSSEIDIYEVLKNNLCGDAEGDKVPGVHVLSKLCFIDASFDITINMENIMIIGAKKIEANNDCYLLERVFLDYDSKIIANLGDVEIEKVSNAYIDAKVDFGDVEISHNNRKASYTLAIICDMGDIEVGN